MSRLIELLRKTGQTAPQPMGFRAGRPAESVPRILIIASLDPDAIDAPADYLEGAGAVLLSAGKVALKDAAAKLPDIPWGISAANADETALKEAVAAGIDFIILPEEGPVITFPDDEKVGIVLQVKSSLEDMTLRTLNDLPVDAVLAGDAWKTGEPVTWRHIMEIKRLVTLLSKPLLVPAGIETTENDLKALGEAGVEGIVVEVDPGSPDGIKKLREIIDRLPPPSARKHGRTEVMLPHAGGETREAIPDEDDDDYE